MSEFAVFFLLYFIRPALLYDWPIFRSAKLPQAIKMNPHKYKNKHQCLCFLNYIMSMLHSYRNQLILIRTAVSVRVYRSVRIGSYSGPYFPTFRLNTERYGESLRIQTECGKKRNRKTPNTDTLHAVYKNALM